MITLCGTPISNYYNKVKLALLEKGVDFTEEFVPPGSTEPSARRDSPIGKVPHLRTPRGPMSESQAILDYLEALRPDPPLVPKEPYALAKVKELCMFIDLNLELVARPLYGQAFFGGSASAETLERVGPLLKKNLEGFQRLARFEPYVAGAAFTQADCCAWASLPLLGLTTKAIYGQDFLVETGIDIKPYAQLIEQRASAQRVKADRQQAQKAMIARHQQNPQVKPDYVPR